jgi:hypothetical protein
VLHCLLLAQIGLLRCTCPRLGAKRTQVPCLLFLIFLLLRNSSLFS